MANTLLTPVAVTRAALVILHQKLNFIGRCNRSYDDSYAQSGAKIGSSLKVRLPNRYSASTGRVMVTQDTDEESVTLTVNNQKHVAMNFTAADLTLSLDDFSDRIIEPAMSVLASAVESDVITNLYKKVYQQVNNIGSAATWNNVVSARKKLLDALAPIDAAGKRTTFTMATQTNVDLVDGLKGLFHDQKELERQYLEGYVARTAGFTFFENTHVPHHASGTDDGTGDYLINGASQTGDELTVDTGTGTFKKGDVITIAGVYDVHPESKAAYGSLKQFVVTADVSANATTIPISPSIVTSGAKQTVSGSPADNAAITKAGGNAASYDVNLAFHRDAFAFATADLEMPRNAHFAARETMDGLSLRIWQASDIINDQFPCRVDILYGYEALRPELACRVATN